jgi:hypothetical protein
MKNLPQLSLALLCVIFACEKDADLDDQLNSEPLFKYNTEAQFIVTESFLIDFEEFTAGDIVSQISIADPFENTQVEGITLAFPNTNAAMVFDSSSPTGNDFDIGTPNTMYGGPGIGAGGASNDVALGNVLILSEDLDPDDPDDIFELGASFFFDFSDNDMVTLNGFDILDIEESPNPTVVNLYNLEGELLFSQVVTPGGDNSKVTVDLQSTSDVAFMEIIMNSSGAIDNIAFEMEIDEPCVNCDSNIVELTFRYNGVLQDAPIRIETPAGEVLFEDALQTNEEFTITTNALDGNLGSDLVVFVDNEQIATLATDCTQVLGPDFIIGYLEIIAGVTETGGQLCPVEPAF